VRIADGHQANPSKSQEPIYSLSRNNYDSLPLLMNLKKDKVAATQFDSVP